MDRIILAIQQLLKEAVNVYDSPLNEIKRVFYGDPITIPGSDLPALAVMPVNTEYIKRGSRYDQKIHSLEIRLVYNSKDYFQSHNSDPDKVYSVQKSVQQVEKSNNSHETLDNTVCGVIQKNCELPYDTVNTAEISQIRSVNYTFNEKRGFPSFEVIINVEAIAIGNR